MFFLLQDFYFMLQSKINGRSVLSIQNKKIMTEIRQGKPQLPVTSSTELNEESTVSDDRTRDQSIPLSCTDGSVQHSGGGSAGRKERQNAPKDEFYYPKDNPPRDTELL